MVAKRGVVHGREAVNGEVVLSDEELAQLVADGATVGMENDPPGEDLYTFVFRSPGRDDVIVLPKPGPNQTALVLNGVPYHDEYGRWDMRLQEFGFHWEEPGQGAPEPHRCAVSGNECPHADKDLGYCALCPGLTTEQRAGYPPVEDTNVVP